MMLYDTFAQNCKCMTFLHFRFHPSDISGFLYLSRQTSCFKQLFNIGKEDSLQNVLLSLEADLQAIGLSVNRAKCKLIHFHEITDDLLDRWAALQVPVCTDACDVLGAVVAKDEQTAITMLNNTDTRWNVRLATLHRRLPFLSLQNQLLVLQRIHASAINHLLSCLPPGVTHTYAEKHDDTLLTILSSSLGLVLPLAPATRQQTMLPFSKGGLGILSARNTCSAAFLSAALSMLSSPLATQNLSATITAPIATSPHYLGLIDHAIRDYKQNQTHVVTTISGETADLPQETFDDILPKNSKEFQPFYASRGNLLPVQHTLTQRSAKNIYKALVVCAETTGDKLLRNWHKSRLRALHASGSQRWMQVLPRYASLRLLDEHVKWNVKLRLGERPQNISDCDRCPMCGEQNALTLDPWHFLSCKVIVSNEGRTRHNTVVLSIAKFARASGVDVKLEPTDTNPDDNLRPDLMLFTHPKALFIDVVVTNPTAPSHCAAGATSTLKVANNMSKKKNKKYTYLVDTMQADFKAFACETYGGLDKQARQVVKKVAKAALLNVSLYAPEDVYSRLMDEVAITIQRGNALMMMAGEAQRKKKLC